VSEIRISEIFGPTIQGEGPLIGKPTVFVRTAGCDYRCSWCDTLYAVLPEYRHEWNLMSADAILSEIGRLSGDRPVLVSLSGGNPALQPLGPLIHAGRAQGHRFALETQGSVVQDWFAALDFLVLSPKPPSSNMPADWAQVGDCIRAAGTRPAVALKIVIFDEADFEFARTAGARFPGIPLYLQPGNPVHETELDAPALLARLQWLIGKVADARWHDAHVLPQLHTLIWGNKRGV
jgi:7-carboxy-7-deazaguanine synthase